MARETTLNDRQLHFVEDDIQMRVLTLRILLLGQPNQLPEQEPSVIENVKMLHEMEYQALEGC